MSTDLWLNRCKKALCSVMAAVIPLLYAPAANANVSLPPSVPLVTKNKAQLVSLGDSITFGEHLPGSKLPLTKGVQGTPSKDAFPYLIARDEKWNVSDLGMAGYSSGQLLKWMNRSKVEAQLTKADVVTLDIGSNDLIHAAYHTLQQMLSNPASASSGAEKQHFTSALDGFEKNLPRILKKIRSKTSAPVVLMTLYDPFPDNTTLHEVAEPLLAKANQIILQTAVAHDCYLVNTYVIMNHHQHELTRNEDIHPTVGGQEAIAKAVERAIRTPEWYHPYQYAVVTHQVNVHTKPTVFSPTQQTLAVGSLVQVIREDKQWLTITQAQSGNSEVGYMQASDFQIVDRPWPMLQTLGKKSTQTAHLGWVAIGTQSMPLLAVILNGVHYSPMKSLVKGIGATSTTNTQKALIQIQTLGQSGISGWWKAHHRPAPNPYIWPPFDMNSKGITKVQKYGMAFHQSTSQTLELNYQVTGMLVKIDGEPVRLGAPVIRVGGDLYLPAKSFWHAVGGITQSGKSS